MPVLDRRRVRSGLKSKGFREEAGSRHDILTYEPSEELTTIATSIPRGSGDKELGHYLVDKIATQLHLTNQEFSELVECAIEQEDYHRLLIERDIIEGSIPKPTHVELDQEQVNEIQSELETLLEQSYERRYSILYGKVDDGHVTMATIEALEELGIEVNY